MKHSITILFIFCTLHASSQQPSTYTQQPSTYIFRHIDQSNGLLHNRVFSIAQDKNGFMWIGTSNGLQRYDGLRFVNYRDELSRWNNRSVAIKSMYADNDRLWLAGELDVGKLDLVSHRVTDYNEDKMLKDSTFQYERYTDQQNIKWLLGKFTIYKYDPVSKRMKLKLFQLAGRGNSSSKIIKDSEQNTWAALENGTLLLFDAKTKKVYSSLDNPLHHPMLKVPRRYGYSNMMMDSKKNIWMCEWNHLLYRYDPATKHTVTYSLKDIKKLHGDKRNSSTLTVFCIYEDSRSNIWVGTENTGLLKYNRDRDNFDCIIASEENRQGIQYNYTIYCIFQDREDNIWIGTDKGISIFNPYHEPFKTIHHRENNPASLPKNEITSFTETETGDILIGTWGGGLTVYDKWLRFKKNIQLKGAYEKNFLWCFIENSDKNIWIGCQHGYLHIYNPANNNISTIHPPEFGDFTIRCMAKDKAGNIWFGLHNGKIAKWDKASNKFFPYNDSIKGLQQKFSAVLNIFIDDSQIFWVSTEDGLKQFDPAKRLYTKIYLPGDSDNSNKISSNSLRGIAQYNDSTLLIGTINGGLNLFNTHAKAFTHFTNNDGLPSNSVYAIRKDINNNVWLTTDFNLNKYNINEKKNITYNIDAGLINSSFESANFYPLRNGRWLTATSTEVLLFHPDSLLARHRQYPKVSISGFKIFGKPFFIDSFLSKSNPVLLNYKQNFLTIEFSELSFSNVQQKNFYYRMSGIDEDWVSAGDKGLANYTNLAPGSYVFSVKTEGGLPAQITTFSILITPPFWQTWWFNILLLLVIASGIYAVVKRRIKTIRNEAELKHKIAEAEMLALRSQMNPHFIFNCLSAIDNLIQTNQPDKATTYLARFAKLIRSVLESSKDNVVPFYKDYETLQLFLQLEQFRCNNKFTYELKADEELLNGSYKVPPLIIQPFVENAIQHGLLNKQQGDKHLIVKAVVENECIKYTICDNGVGRIKAQQIKNMNKPEHQSFGIYISEERIHLHNQNNNKNDVIFTDLIKDGMPAGTRVDIRIKSDEG